jgi:hypothetical protein
MTNENTTVAAEMGTENKPAVPDAAGIANLDKVRDILFGAQAREFERRLARLEEQLLRGTAELKDDVRNRLAALERFMHEETEMLAGRLQTERDERTTQAAETSRTLHDTAQALERKTATLEDQLSRAQRDLRQQLLAQQQRLSDDIGRTTEEILARLARESQELRTVKADRATVASLLTEMAMRLTNDLAIPGFDEAGNG